MTVDNSVNNSLNDIRTGIVQDYKEIFGFKRFFKWFYWALWSGSSSDSALLAIQASIENMKTKVGDGKIELIEMESKKRFKDAVEFLDSSAKLGIKLESFKNAEFSKSCKLTDVECGDLSLMSAYGFDEIRAFFPIVVSTEKKNDRLIEADVLLKVIIQRNASISIIEEANPPYLTDKECRRLSKRSVYPFRKIRKVFPTKRAFDLENND